jgi:tetratricopeptide (TPR) repeat protein
VSIAALVISAVRGRYEERRNLRSQLNEVLKAMASNMIERQKQLYEAQKDAAQVTNLSVVFNQQLSFLREQAKYLAEQIPHLVTPTEYGALASAYGEAGDAILAEEFYRRSTETAPPGYYRMVAIRGFCYFLYTQRRFEEARTLYGEALSQWPASDNLAKYHKGLTYQYCGINERLFANAPRRAEEAFESAANEFRGIDFEFMRDHALKGLETAKLAQQPSSGVSPQPNNGPES